MVTRAGSGTLFFSECTLRCAACQNCQISQHGIGTEVDPELLAAIMVRLEERGASNINIVTGTHFAPSIAAAVSESRRLGMKLPIVWNSSGYERVETLEHLSGIVDIWLPDLKTLDSALSAAALHARDYPLVARDAIRWMLERGGPRFDGEALVSGTIVRHLVLPGRFDDTDAVLSWLSQVLPSRGLLSLMVQYLPIGGPRDYPDRSLSETEYAAVLSLLSKYGFDDGYVQELVEDQDWTPDFLRANPFPSTHADPVWHWRDGFLV